jgi:hypothetical protein
MRSFIALPLLVLAACSKPSATQPPPGGEGDVPVTVRVPIDLQRAPSDSHSGVNHPLFEVITTQSRWSELWRAHASRGDPVAPEPMIDFSKEAVFVAALGDRPSSGYIVSLSASSRDAFFRFEVLETRPGIGCIRMTEITQPIAFAIVSAQPAYYTIETKVEESPCK